MFAVKSYQVLFIVTVTVMMFGMRHCVAGKTPPSYSEFIEHLNRVENFICSVPQKRAFTIHQIIEESPEKVNINPNRIIQPSMTVLHRCENAGCCKIPGQNCSVTDDGVEIVELVFYVHSVPEWKVTSISARNHTKCGCDSTYSPK